MREKNKGDRSEYDKSHLRLPDEQTKRVIPMVWLVPVQTNVTAEVIGNHFGTMSIRDRLQAFIVLKRGKATTGKKKNK